MRRLLSGDRADQATRGRGQALAEFALVAPLLFLLILGTIEAGRFIFFNELMHNATREGARFAIVHGADSTCPSGPPRAGETNDCDPAGDNVKAAVRSAALNLASLGDLFLYEPVWTASSILTKPSPGDANTGNNGRGEYVTVFLDFTYQPLIEQVLGVGVLPDIEIRSESTLVVNY